MIIIVAILLILSYKLIDRYYKKENTYRVRCETCERISYESCVQYSENYNKGYKDGRIDRSNGVKVKWWPGSVYPFIKEYQEEPRPMAIHTPTFENYLELLSKEAYIEGYVEGYSHGPKYK